MSVPVACSFSGSQLIIPDRSAGEQQVRAQWCRRQWSPSCLRQSNQDEQTICCGGLPSTEAGRDFEVLATLRGLLGRLPVGASSAVGALAPADRSARANEVVPVQGRLLRVGLSMTRFRQHKGEALLLLVSDLNGHTRFGARRMRVPGMSPGPKQC
jgi:hypothetical protein